VTDEKQPKGTHVPRAKQKQLSFLPSTFVLIIGLAIVVGYAAGTRNDQIVSTVAPILGFKVETGKLDLSSVQTTFQQLKSNFDGKLSDEALIEGASKGLVAAAGDIHTEYFTSKEAAQFKDDLNGTIGGGIGAQIGMREDHPTIVSVLKDTPAEKQGLIAGDVLLSVNDEEIGKLTVDQVVNKIRGDVGTTVKVTISRNGQVKDVTLTREEITSPSVTTKVDGDVGIMTIARFDEQTADAARNAAQQFKQQNVKKVILDLRDNGGGYLSAAPQVAGLWVSGDKVIVSERKDGTILDEQRSGDNAPLAGIPTVVLVNAGTASAAEIVTSALKEYGVASVVGQKTYGKGTVQTMLNLDSGALLKVTIQRWYTPKGNNVDKKGITPDQTVDLTRDDVNTGHDPQLDAAKQRLSK
jgi:carboxyl-terminal processing protease